MNSPNIQSLFESIPKKDYCNLFAGAHPKPKEVMNILNYSKKDLAVATGFPASAIRYDQRMNSEIENRLKEWATAINLVASYFKDVDRTMIWFQTRNPLLGNVSPADMIKMGRFPKLLRFIQLALDENRKSA